MFITAVSVLSLIYIEYLVLLQSKSDTYPGCTNSLLQAFS